jgi:hypothetical protein
MPFGGTTPGALFDDSAGWYDSADDRDINGTRLHSPPYANLANPVATCNSATINGVHSCQMVADIHEWFNGAGFPSSWSQPANPAFIQLNAYSDCNEVLPFGSFQGDALVRGYVECNGNCDNNAQDSGCCIMKKPFVVVAPGAACPPGYTRNVINSGITDFVFPHSATPSSQDTTLINFLQLLTARKYDFDSSVPFVDVALGNVNGICIINGSGFGDNVDAWGNKAYTESCPFPFTTPGNGSRGCPQFLPGGGLTACGTGSLPACSTVPTGTNCPAGGCPKPPDACVGNACESSDGSWLAPSERNNRYPRLPQESQTKGCQICQGQERKG